MREVSPMIERHPRLLALGTAAPAFALPDPSGKLWSLEDFSAARAVLVAFLCNHCPFVQHMLEGFVAFARDYGRKGLAVVAINPNDSSAYPADAPQQMARIAADKNFPFPYLIDASQRVALAYQAVCTPDLFLFDSARTLVYRGRFDDSSPGNKTPVTGAELRAALEALLSGKRIEQQIASLGCSIKWKPENAPQWA
ncbi:MAG: thioredoxin family protein [Steroidobacteraceae bacterium]